MAHILELDAENGKVEPVCGFQDSWQVFATNYFPETKLLITLEAIKVDKMNLQVASSGNPTPIEHTEFYQERWEKINIWFHPFSFISLFNSFLKFNMVFHKWWSRQYQQQGDDGY